MVTQPLDKNTDASITVFLHNNSTTAATGNAVAVDIMKTLVIPNKLVRSISVYHQNKVTNEWTLFERLEYGTLKRLRKQSTS